MVYMNGSVEKQIVEIRKAAASIFIDLQMGRISKVSYDNMIRVYNDNLKALGTNERV